MPLKGRTSWNKIRHSENMSKQFYGSSKFEIQKRKPETLEESVRPFVSSRLSKQEISGTQQHRQPAFYHVFKPDYPTLRCKGKNADGKWRNKMAAMNDQNS